MKQKKTDKVAPRVSRTKMRRLFGEFADPLSRISQMMIELHNDLVHPPEGVDYEIYVDLFENDGTLILEAPVPGVDPKEVLLKVSSEALSLSGEVLESADYNEEEAFISETMFGKFSRNIILPYNVDVNSTEAFYRDGIIRVEMPIEEDAEDPPRRITITRPSS